MLQTVGDQIEVCIRTTKKSVFKSKGPKQPTIKPGHTCLLK
uniref:Uncharacterized protein n=1 Tax=Rhizophora mucronata TaxID=61149 RepID=A0A2P2NBN0_RHIMU